MLPPPQHENSVEHEGASGQVKEIHWACNDGIGFQEFPDESLGAIETGEEIKTVHSSDPGPSAQKPEVENREGSHGERFVELHRMAVDAVAKIHAPGKA